MESKEEVNHETTRSEHPNGVASEFLKYHSTLSPSIRSSPNWTDRAAGSIESAAPARIEDYAEETRITNSQ
jgi:hypothetical protein